MANRNVIDARVMTGIDLGKCIKFSSSNSVLQSVSTLPSAYYPANMPNFTVACWVYLFSISANGFRFSEWSPTAGTGGLLFAYSPTLGVQAIVKHSTTDAASNSGAGTVPLGVWTRLMTTWKQTDSTPNIYINAITSNNTTTSKSGTINVPFTTGVTGYIGNRAALDRPFTGLMDEFTVWPRVLTEDERWTDFRKCIMPSDYITRLKMDEVSGSVLDIGSAGVNFTPSNVVQNIASYTTGNRTYVAPGTRTPVYS